MIRFTAVVLLLASFVFFTGCRKTTPSTPVTMLTDPADSEEAALQVVGNLYGFYVAYNKTAPTGWDDLKAQASKASSDAQQKAFDAIDQIQAAGYKMKWGVDKSVIAQAKVKPGEYVIAESADGRRKLMFSGIVKTEKSEE